MVRIHTSSIGREGGVGAGWSRCGRFPKDETVSGDERCVTLKRAVMGDRETRSCCFPLPERGETMS